MLKLENISKSYQNADAVKNLSITVQPGQILGLIGPNGAGKTTTLRIASGLVTPDAGHAQIAGFDILRQPVEAKQLLAFLPDQPVFFETVTCWEHIKFTADAYQVKNWQSKAEELLRLFELQDKRTSFPSELSKGMKQRLGLICCLIHSPKLLFLDEPMIGLDPHAIKTLNQYLSKIAQEGAAIILSSHLLSYLEQVCTHILVLDKGQQLLVAEMKEIKSRKIDPQSPSSLEELFLQLTSKERT